MNVLSMQRLGAAGKALLRAAFWGQLLPWQEQDIENPDITVNRGYVIVSTKCGTRII